MILLDSPRRTGRGWEPMDRAAGGLAADLGLFALAAVFAGVTAATSTLVPHRAWGAVAVWGYAGASIAVIGQLLLRRIRPATGWTGPTSRAIVTALTWTATTLLPLVIQSIQRSAGRTDRAQEEVVVVEVGGERLLSSGSPYLGHDQIAALPPAEQLLGYFPYQPGMALFGLPRAIIGDSWWTDARVWFAVVTAIALVAAAVPLWDRSRQPGGQYAVIRAVQFATVLPICALTLATGGDDLPVLALCLLALSYAAGGRTGASGLAVGAAAALKLFAWPVALVLFALAWTRGPGSAGRFAAGAAGLPILALLPACLTNGAAAVENVIRFPLGQGLVGSPAQSPLPGYLLASALPAGRVIAAALLLAAGIAIAVRLIRRPPRTAATAAAICGYGLLIAIALMPSTRFGYLLYPLAFLAWAGAYRCARPGAQVDRPGAQVE